MTRLTQYRAPATALLLMAAGPVFSAHCGAPSPRLIELGDAYYAPIQSHRQTAIEVSALPAGSTLGILLRSEFRSGSGTRTACLGTGDHRRAVIDEFVLEDIRRDRLLNGEHVLTALEAVSRTHAPRDERIDHAGTVRSRQLSLPPASTWQPMSSSRSMTTVVSRRRSNALGLTFLQEQVWSVMPSGSGVEIKVDEYVNGRHGGSILWRLKSS